MLARRITVVLVSGLCALAAAAQERGDLLIATEQIDEETFSETVVLLLHYEEDGAIGVAINRPTWVTTRELFPDLDEMHRYRGPVFHGGPLAQATVLILSRDMQLGDGDREPIVDGVYLTSNLSLLEKLPEGARDDTRLRFYAGHVSWGPGQLDEEIAAGAWQPAAASAALIFDAEPRTLWTRLSALGPGLTVREVRQPAGASADRAAYKVLANAE